MISHNFKLSFQEDKTLENVRLKLATLMEILALTYIKTLTGLGEIFLCLGTLFGPLIYLLIALLGNVYLMVKPVVHSLAPWVSYKAAFQAARKDIAAFVIEFGKVMYGFEVEGLDHIPGQGGALIVYYHGALPIDYIITSMMVLTEKNRIVSSVIDRFLYRLPLFEILYKGFSFHAGEKEFCTKWLKSGNLLGLAPGGAYEAQFGTTNYEIMWRNRVGFAKIAIDANVPIIPVFTENIREAVVNMQTGLKSWRNVYEKTRLPLGTNVRRVPSQTQDAYWGTHSSKRRHDPSTTPARSWTIHARDDQPAPEAAWKRCESCQRTVSTSWSQPQQD